MFAKYGSSGVPATPNNLAAWAASSSGKHKGVNQTKTSGGRADEATTQVEITGSANIYRTKNGNNSYQTYFASEAGATKAKEVTIKITINKVTASTGR